jgi:hypothetical protein
MRIDISYINQILRPVLLPLLNKHAGVVFQQDNDRPHIVQISRIFLQQAELEILPWPAPPNLNPHRWHRTCVGYHWWTFKMFSSRSKQFEGDASSPRASLE